MLRVLILLAAAAAVSAVTYTRDLPGEVYDREHEPNPKEFRPFKMADLIRNFCENVRGFMDEKRAVGVKPRNALELSNVILLEFDGNSDGCISSSEIRDIAARFRGDLTGYRTLFEQILDENKNGCTESDELNALVLDCTMPSVASMRAYPDKYTIPFDRETDHETPQESGEDAAVGEEEEEEENMVEEEIVDPELGADEAEDRRQLLEQENAAAAQEAGLNPAMKEMICSMVRRQHEDAVFGIKLLKEIVDLDGDDVMSFNEFYEFLTGVRVGREESDHLAAMIDGDGDGVLTTEELLEAVDWCPVPEPVDIPVVNTRPMIHTADVPCPSESEMYKYLRTLAMKFLGRTAISGQEVRDIAEQLYISITGDIEETITPANLDVPMNCVKECWREIDSNKDGLLDLFEFNRIALDILEEFIPRPEKKNRIQNARLELDLSETSPIAYEELPRDSMDVLTNAAIIVYREMGIRIPEADMMKLVNLLYQDASTAALLEKISEAPITEEGMERVASVIRPAIHQLQQH